MESEHIRHCLLFYFYQKKSAIDARRIMRKLCENVIVIRTCANWFKRFKNDDFDISNKEHSAVVERERIVESRKKVENDEK